MRKVQKSYIRRTKKPETVKAVDWWSRVLALIAISISLLTVYLTHFYRTERLSVMVIGIPDIRVADNGFGFKGNLQLSFFNYGNTPVTVTGISIQIQQNADGDNLDSCGGDYSNIYFLKSQPFAIKSGESVTKEVSVTLEMEKIPFVGPSIKTVDARLINSCFGVAFVALERRWFATNFLARWGVGPDSLSIAAGQSYAPYVLVDRIIPLFYWSEEPILFQRN